MSTTTTDQTLSLPAVFSRALSSASDVYHLSSIEDETQVFTLDPFTHDSFVNHI